MATLLEQIDVQIDNFIQENDAFQSACDRCFSEADKDDDGRLSLTEALSKVDAIFLDIDDVLKLAQITVDKPSIAKVEELMKKADVNQDDALDENEFTLFYRQVLKLAAFSSARGFVAKHGTAVVAAVTSAVAIQTGKRKFEIPEEMKPLLQYATPFISIGVGLLARYGITVKKTSEVEKTLFRTEAFKKPKEE